jgi:DNA mismatch repair protein MutL
VGDLFYNLPARRKFLKSDAAESAQISRVVTQLALANPGVGFVLTSAGREIFQCPPVGSLGERFYQLYGDRPDLVEVGKAAAGIRLAGYIAALAEQGPTRGPQHLFVNRRIVKDRTIAHAIGEAYGAASIKERSPEVHLFIEMAPDWVDVNVHPTKAEVRFRDQSTVHEVVRRALGAALGTGPAPELQLRPQEREAQRFSPQTIPGILSTGSFTDRWAVGAGLPEPATRGGVEPVGPQARADGAGGLGQAPSASIPADPDRIRPMIPLGQFRDTFIVAVDGEGIAIIDQHVAHERVLFERAMERLGTGRLESQRLLEPLLVELSAGGREALASMAAELDRFGFELADFGGDAVRIAALPALLSPGEAAAAVRALADDLEGLDRGARVDEALRRIAATTACHAAVKANAPLTMEKMVHILDELRRTAYSTVCPHGRPVMLRLTRREIERNFQRI